MRERKKERDRGTREIEKERNEGKRKIERDRNEVKREIEIDFYDSRMSDCSPHIPTRHELKSSDMRNSLHSNPRGLNAPNHSMFIHTKEQ